MTGTLDSKIEIKFGDQRVQLRGDGSAFLPDEHILLVADLHLGKDASFRFAGVPVPSGINAGTLDLLSKSIESCGSEKVIVLGDMIHDGNSMTPDLVQQFSNWRTIHSNVGLSLVRGNHDRYVDSFPEPWQLKESASMKVGSVDLVHETTIDVDSLAGKFQIGGHWHPVISVGRGADEMRVPCFVATENSLTLPAFGEFKGGMKQRKVRGCTYYPVCDGKIWVDRAVR
jgi:DNA ligase-associated metallophosphoesterase